MFWEECDTNHKCFSTTMINESYTPNMRRIFSPYLKQIGDWFASTRNTSVQKMEFEEFLIDEPLTLSAFCKASELYDLTNRIYQRCKECYGSAPNTYFVICKHKSGGITAFETSYERWRFEKPSSPFTAGDTSGKITHAYIAFDRKCYDYRDGEITGVGELRGKRSDNKRANSMGLNRRAVNRIIAISNNPVCREIRARARAMGCRDAMLYAIDDGYIHVDSNISIRHRYDKDIIGYTFRIDSAYKAHKTLDTKLKSCVDVQVDVDAYSFSESNDDHYTDFDHYIEAYEKYLSKLKQFKEFVDYIGNFTIADILIDLPD